MRAVRVESFGGPEGLRIHNVEEPHAAAGELRIRVNTVGLNPMDWVLSSMPDVADMFGVTLPSGFGHDFAGVVDEVGDGGADGFDVGDRVFGGALARAAAEWVIVRLGTDPVLHIPEGMGDDVAAALYVPGSAADAAVTVIGVGADDTVLIGGASGGVGVFAVQLARAAGARVIGTASESTFDFVRQLGAEPVAYGPGLAERVRALAPDGITAAISLVGTETIDVALELGVSPDRISSIAAGPNPPGGVRATGGEDASPGAVQRIADAVATGQFVVPIAASFELDEIAEAVATQQGGHVHGKIVVTL